MAMEQQRQQHRYLPSSASVDRRRRRRREEVEAEGGGTVEGWQRDAGRQAGAVANRRVALIDLWLGRIAKVQRIIFYSR